MQVDPVAYDDQINLYTYVGNDSVNALDPSGRDILYAAHRLALGYYHTKIVIVPQNQGLYRNDRRFETTPKGTKFATLGAGAEYIVGAPLGLGGRLIGERNRPSDVKDPFIVIEKLTVPEGVTEDAMIGELFRLNENYEDNLEYTTFPGRGEGYNSNSYARGLLDAAGFRGVKTPGVLTPGSSKPVPPDEFGVSSVTVTVKACHTIPDSQVPVCN